MCWGEGDFSEFTKHAVAVGGKHTNLEKLEYGCRPRVGLGVPLTVYADWDEAGLAAFC